MVRCVILGAGGHAAVLVDLISAARSAEIAGFVDVDAGRWNTPMMGFPILGGDALLPDLKRCGVTHFVVGAGIVAGRSNPRRMLFDLGAAVGLRPLTLVHPAAVVAASAQVAAGAQLLPGCIVNARAAIGLNTVVNSGAVIEHDCVVGIHAHVASGAVVCGGVRVGDGTHIGAGAVVRQGLSIGARAVIGAGAAVVKDVLPDTTVVGVPARPYGA